MPHKNQDWFAIYFWWIRNLLLCTEKPICLIQTKKFIWIHIIKRRKIFVLINRKFSLFQHMKNIDILNSKRKFLSCILLDLNNEFDGIKKHIFSNFTCSNTIYCLIQTNNIGACTELLQSIRYFHFKTLKKLFFQLKQRNFVESVLLNETNFIYC